MAIDLNQNITSTQPEHNPYIMDPNNRIVSVRDGGRFNDIKILQYQDGTEWVLLQDKQKERFCGYLYLKDAIAGHNSIKPAENKIGLLGKKVIYLSKYCGEQKLTFEDNSFLKVMAALKQAGFTDTTANLRKIGDQAFVFDTEKTSFAKEMHEMIDAYSEEHDTILAAVEAQKLNG